MKITRTNDKNGTMLTLEGELTIYTVTSAQAYLLNDIDGILDPLGLDLSSVTEIDTAGVQLLLFAKTVLNDCNKRVYIKDNNEQVDEVLNFLGTAHQFHLENVA